MGAKVYILTSVQDISAAYRNTTTLSFDDAVDETMRSFGLSEDGIGKLWRHDYPGICANPSNKPFARLCHDIYKTQLHPGNKLDDLTHRLLSVMSKNLLWENLPSSAILQGRPSSRRVSLMALCYGGLLDVANTAIFGSKLDDISRDITKHFQVFDAKAWQLLFQLPPAFASEMIVAKTEIVKAFQHYVKSPPETKADRAWLIEALETEMGALSMSAKDQAVMFFMLYWL